MRTIGFFINVDRYLDCRPLKQLAYAAKVFVNADGGAVFHPQSRK
jgi:hypothetical protein